MAVYQKPYTGITLNTTNSVYGLRPSATIMFRVLESYIGGEATTSTVLRAGVSRFTADGTGTAPTVYTAQKLNPLSQAAATVVHGGLSALVAFGTLQETLGDPLVVHAFNAFGGTDRWVPQPGEEIMATGAIATNGISLRSLSGVPIVSGHAIFEEM
jgi:hypothetical protein